MIAFARDAPPQALVAVGAPAAPTLRTETKGKARRAGAAKKPTNKRKKLHLRTRELTRFRCQNLELDIMNLRQEIASLERARSVLYARTLNRADALDGSVLKTIHQFYRLLRHGFNDVVWLEDQGGGGPRALDFRKFIYTSFDDVLALGPDLSQRQPRGRDHLIEHFCHMTALTGAPNVEMVDVRIHSSSDGRTATVVVKTTCTSPLSVLMLEAKYAHVSLYPELKAKLVGRTIVAYGEARYVFDLKTGRIVLADVQADHASAILQVVDTADEYEILYRGTSDIKLAQLIESESPTIRSEPTIETSKPPRAGAQSKASVSAMSLDFVLSPDSSPVSDGED